jgi:hypothetical protein
MQKGEKLEAWRQKRRIVQCAVNLASKLAPYVDGRKDDMGAGAGTMDRYMCLFMIVSVVLLHGN